MKSKQDYSQIIRQFKSKWGVETSDENIAATMHLMNTHSIDLSAAFDQSSKGGGYDQGIDGWHFDAEEGELFIYQSKLTESKSIALEGLNDLNVARIWLEEVLLKESVERIPSPHHLYNLYKFLAKSGMHLKKISFILVSLFNKNELEDSSEYKSLENELIKSDLNKFVSSKKGKLILNLEEYNFETSLPSKIKKYSIVKLESSRLEIRKNAYLDLVYIPLYNLVELYRQRGDILFDKNVRLSLIETKKAKDLLVHPMNSTLHKICSGEANSNIFTFYHIGVTIAASNSDLTDKDLFLENPSIINGCQTITIANQYLKSLEQEKNQEFINRFKKINVIAKVVVGTTDDELKEITNANNRANPIDPWQLFSNDPIHIELEATLRDYGIFYERQKGKFSAYMKIPTHFKDYPNTNQTFIKVEDLGQIICLGRENLQWAAKPSEIFLNKERHNEVFDKSLPKYPKDIILIYNLFKSIKCALTNYLDLPVHSDKKTQKIFDKPIIRTHMYYVALIYFYQSDSKHNLRKEYSTTLLKKASSILVDEFETFFQRSVSKTKNWYLKESNELKNEVSSRSREHFFQQLASEIGIDLEKGNKPFTKYSITWSEYED